MGDVMFERFTERARQVVTLAQEEARKMESMVLLDHLVLGILREEEGVAARVLDEMGAFYEDVLKEIPQPIIKHRDAQITERSKKALELALREALALGHNYIGTEHILLGIASVKALNGDTIAHFPSDLIRKYVLDFLATDRENSEALKDGLKAIPKFTSEDRLTDALNSIWDELQVIRGLATRIADAFERQ